MAPLRRAHGFIHRPILWLALGGFGAQTALRLRQRAHQRLDSIPKSWRFVVVDFTSDAPMPDGLPSNAGETSDEALSVGFDREELGLLDTSQWNVPGLADRIEAGEPDAAWLREIVHPAILREYPGGEALAIPAMARVLAAYAAFRNGERSWVAKIRRGLEYLAQDGPGRQKLLQAGTPGHLIDPNPVTQVVLIAGACGGTGRGLLIPAAATTTSLARRIGPVQLHAYISVGHYREKDGREFKKAALSQSLLMDLERVMRPTAHVRFPLGPHRIAETHSRLFESVGCIDASGPLLHNPDAVVERAVDALWYWYATRQGSALSKSRDNIRFEPRATLAREEMT